MQFNENIGNMLGDQMALGNHCTDSNKEKQKTKTNTKTKTNKK